MQGKHLYEYAVIRFVPRVEREEFINVGIIMFSKRARFIKARYRVDEKKLCLFSSELDMDSLYASLKVFDRICSGDCRRWSDSLYGYSRAFPLADGCAQFFHPDFASASRLFD